jgi:hypothetical protein
MIDISLIRRHRPIVTVADYLLLPDLPISLEHPKGEWDRLGYHNTGATLHVFPNNDYDAAVLRVDALPVTASTALANLQKMQKEKPGHEAEGGWTDAQKELSRKARELFAKLKDEKEVWGGQKHYLDWEEVKKELGAGGWIGETDDELMKKLEEVGVYPLHTFRGSHGMEYVRTVTEPLTQVGLVETMRGFKEDFDPIKADVRMPSMSFPFQSACSLDFPLTSNSFFPLFLSRSSCSRARLTTGESPPSFGSPPFPLETTLLAWRSIASCLRPCSMRWLRGSTSV